MAKLNVWKRMFPVRTHEGAVAQRVDPRRELRRSVLTCLLWEDTFYEKGNDIAKRIAELVARNKQEDVAALAREAREKVHPRHVPLFLTRELARRKGAGPLVADTLEQVVQRADELGEFVALYWKARKEPLSAGVKRGLAKAFAKFDAYQLAKYNRESTVKLRDVLSCATPSRKTQNRPKPGKSSLRTRSNLPTLGRLPCPQGRTSARPGNGCCVKTRWAEWPCCATCG
jgi:TROVE domain